MGKRLEEGKHLDRAELAELAELEAAERHTPGPWTSICPPSISMTTRYIQGEHGEHIAKIGHMDYSSGSQDSDLANARLIAAAPELLAALQGLLKWAPTMDGDTPHQIDATRARAAIARATGAT